jgi:hypothetical protein
MISSGYSEVDLSNETTFGVHYFQTNLAVWEIPFFRRTLIGKLDQGRQGLVPDPGSATKPLGLREATAIFFG